MRIALAASLAFLLGCAVPEAPPAKAPAPQQGIVRKGTLDGVNIALARAKGEARGFSWEKLGPEAFAKAKRERKLILLDGAAEWCHWCHVMDETTYADPEVGKELAAHFVAIKVDIDEHPDIAERYGEYGWPATILLSPDAEEIGKYRGYLPKNDLLEILHAVAQVKPEVTRRDPFDLAPPLVALPWIAGRLAVDMDGYYDTDEAGWGKTQKAPLGQNVTFELRRAAHGDLDAKERALSTLRKHALLLDPVWGGIYQYSVGHTWKEPHYEKLMTYQAWNLEAFARAYAATKDPKMLEGARSIARYLTSFLSNAEGAFLVSQDADANAHDAKAAFIDGDVYYRLGDAQRRALGVPRVDDHVYGYENGLAIGAFIALFEATSPPGAALGPPPFELQRARKAIDLLLRTLVLADGSVERLPKGPRYLADAASFGFSLARFAEVTQEAAYLERATKVAAAMLRDFGDASSDALYDRTVDPAAVGVFARRGRPFMEEMLAARFLAALARATHDATWAERGKKIAAAACTPRALDERGRMLGDALLTLDDLGLVAW